MWHARQESEKSDGTAQSYFHCVRRFADWLEDERITDLNDLDGRDVFRYDSHRRTEVLSKNALDDQLGTIKLFLEFCVDIEAVPPERPAKVDVPTLSKDERANGDRVVDLCRSQARLRQLLRA